MVTPEKVLSPCKPLTNRVLHEKARNCRDSGVLWREEVTAEPEQGIVTRVSFGLVGAADKSAVPDYTNTMLTIWHSGCASCILLCQANPHCPKASLL